MTNWIKVTRSDVWRYASPDQLEYNATVKTIIEDVAQTQKLEDGVYVPAQLRAAKLFVRPFGAGGEIAKIAQPTSPPPKQVDRFDLAELGSYERTVFSALAWYRYDTYVIGGELGTGKTTTARHVLSFINKHKEPKCGDTCGLCRHPIQISVNFNAGYHQNDADKLKFELCSDLYDQLRKELRHLFLRERLAAHFLEHIRRGDVDHHFASFDRWVERLEKEDGALLASPGDAGARMEREIQLQDRLFRFVDDDSTDSEQRTKKLLAMCRFIKLRVRPDGACFVLFFDNIDSVPPECQGILLQLLLSYQEISGAKCLVALRPSTFGTVKSARAYSFGLIEHAGPGVLAVIQARLQRLIESWSDNEAVQAIQRSEFKEAFRARAQYALDNCHTDGALQVIEWLAGENTRLALRLLPQAFATQVLPYDEAPRHKYDCMRALLVGSSEQLQVDRNDQHVANLFCDSLSGELSTINWRILQICLALKEHSEERNVGTVAELLKASRPDLSIRNLIGALNYLLDLRRPLIWADGVSSIDVEDELPENLVISVTSAGESYLRELARELVYIQECFTAVKWPEGAVPERVDFKLLSERLRLVRKGLVQLVRMDDAELKALIAAQGSHQLIPGVRLKFFSNRVVHRAAESALRLIESNREAYGGGELFDELLDWQNLLVDGFNRENTRIGVPYAPLKNLEERFREIAAGLEVLKREEG